MLLLAGPRQSGKTTIAQIWLSELANNSHYFNWDNQDDRTLLLQGPAAIANTLHFDQLRTEIPRIVFDEIHKYSHWKTFIKGFYDTYKSHCQILITGSAQLNIYQRGGDSLMGRYFMYRIHPFSVAECIRTIPSEDLISSPVKLDQNQFDALWQFGGFPEPMIKQNQRFYNRWQQLRKQQLFREDIRDLTRIQEIKQLELLGTILENQAGQLITYNNLAMKTRVSSDTIRRWINILEEVYFCFRIQPWTQNISRSLLKEPKIYMWDWSVVADPGQRAENFIASHLLKAVHLWTDMGFGEFGLYFIRDKEQREVDFLVTKNNTPWFLVEVKKNDRHLSPALIRFHEKLQTNHAFQVVLDMEYVDADCFEHTEPLVVPAITFLSQLL
ncbi:MAG: ATP-binding protein [Legionellales bacterium]|nr:ATP-binding protein [Legionellales bacterium]